MTKWHTIWKPDHPIYQRLSQGTKIFLNERGTDVLDWLWDSSRLIEGHKSADYSDYSFTIAPAYKALEKWLILLAPHLGVPNETIQAAQESGKLGLFLSDKNIDGFFDAVLEKLALIPDKKSELRAFVQSLNSVLKNFRHNPAHCGTVIENVLKAESDFLTWLNTMDRITQTLIDNDVIPYSGYRVDPKETKKLNDERKRLASL